jgi:hypothetical protein
MARDPPWDTAVRGSHAPGVGAGEPRTSPTARGLEGTPTAATADGEGPDLLGRAVEALEELRSSLQVLRPETVVRWHRQGFSRYWAWKSRRLRGRPAIGRELRDLIRRMSRAKSALGRAADPRRAVEAGSDGLGGDGFEIHGPASAAAVTGLARVSEERRQESDRVGFLHGAYRDLSGLFVFVVLSHGRRRLVHFNVTEHPTAEWTARQLIEACGLEESPRHLIRDRDGVYGERFSRQARTLDIREAVIAPRSPWQNAYAERVIGSIRRECLDHVVVIGEMIRSPRITRRLREATADSSDRGGLVDSARG